MVIASPSFKDRLTDFGIALIDGAVRIYESPTTKWVVGGLFTLKLADMVMENRYNAKIKYGEAEVSMNRNDPQS